jgi:hypothetical protein
MRFACRRRRGIGRGTAPGGAHGRTSTARAGVAARCALGRAGSGHGPGTSARLQHSNGRVRPRCVAARTRCEARTDHAPAVVSCAPAARCALRGDGGMALGAAPHQSMGRTSTVSGGRASTLGAGAETGADTAPAGWVSTLGTRVEHGTRLPGQHAGRSSRAPGADAAQWHVQASDFSARTGDVRPRCFAATDAPPGAH